jgi:hypothetical protein
MKRLQVLAPISWESVEMQTSSPQQAESRLSFDPHPTLDAVQSELHHILSTQHFCNSAVLSRFLRYVVEQTLQGNGERLKEYRLGIDVFARTASFDPRGTRCADCSAPCPCPARGLLRIGRAAPCDSNRDPKGRLRGGHYE